MSDVTYIYSLVDPRDGAHRYVGKTSYPMRVRLAAHKYAAKRGNLPVNRWARKVANINFGPVINWLETVDAGDDWAAREKFWIAEFRRRGAKLLNLTDGGEGLTGHVFTEEHRGKISAGLRRGKLLQCACGSEFWRKPSDIAKGNARFCSKPCYQKSLKGVSKPMPTNATIRGVDAAASKRTARTHCLRGHPLSGENLFINSSGSRGCKECRRGHKRAYLAKLKV